MFQREKSSTPGMKPGTPMSQESNTPGPSGPPQFRPVPGKPGVDPLGKGILQACFYSLKHLSCTLLLKGRSELPKAVCWCEGNELNSPAFLEKKWILCIGMLLRRPKYKCLQPSSQGYKLSLYTWDQLKIWICTCRAGFLACTGFVTCSDSINIGL